MLFQMEFKVGMPGSLPDLPEVDHELIGRVFHDAMVDFKNGWHDRSIFNEEGEVIGSWGITDHEEIWAQMSQDEQDGINKVCPGLAKRLGYEPDN